MPRKLLPSWPPHWPRPRLSLVLAWAVALLFIVHWVVAYDACRTNPESGSSRFLCIISSFITQLILWAVWLLALVVALIERVLR